VPKEGPAEAISILFDLAQSRFSREFLKLGGGGADWADVFFDSAGLLPPASRNSPLSIFNIAHDHRSTFFEPVRRDAEKLRDCRDDHFGLARRTTLLPSFRRRRSPP
jgi:hypothetical protein